MTKKKKALSNNKKRKLNQLTAEAASMLEVIASRNADQILKFEQICQQMLEIDPNCALAYSFLGEVTGHLGQAEMAESLYKKACDAEPKNAQAWCFLGNFYCNHSRFEEALTAFDSSLEINPGHDGAVVGAGKTHFDMMNPQRACELYEQGIKANPNSAIIYNYFALLLSKMKKNEAARKNFVKALSLDPKYTEAHYNFAVYAYQQGDFELAKKEARLVIKFNPGFASAYSLLSKICKYENVNDPEIRAMERLYVQSVNQPESRKRLAFTLGSVFERLKLYDRSFDCFVEGNRLRREEFEYHIDADKQVFEDVKASFDPRFIEEHQNVGSQDQSPIFILGMPRSGTSLVEQIMLRIHRSLVVVNSICYWR